MAATPRLAHELPANKGEAVFASAADVFAVRGIAVLPLGLDEDGFPKKPLIGDYTLLQPGDNVRHDWRTAKGLGIVLGRPSACLAAIDVDDVGLAEYIRNHLSDGPQPPLQARTVRDRLHVYVQEPQVSWPVDLEVRYQGRRCLVQLLATGCQVAAPPTPGYSWVDAKCEPLYGLVEGVWRRISLDLNLPYRTARPWSSLRRGRSRGPTTAEIRRAAQ